MSEKEILTEKAESCDTPDDYVRVATEIVQALSDKEWAGELLDEGIEWARTTDDMMLFARCAVNVLEDTAKASQYFSQAKDYAMKIDELIGLATAAVDLGISDRAAEVLAAAQAKCIKMADYFDLSLKIKAILKDPVLAEKPVDAAIKKCSSVVDAIECAGAVMKGLKDSSRAESILKEWEGRCKTGKEFATLAEGVYGIFEDEKMARAVFEKGEREALGGHDLVLLGNAALSVLDDKEYAASLYRIASERMEKGDELMLLARNVALSLGDASLALLIYQRASEFCTTVEQLLNLAESILADTQNREAAGSVFRKIISLKPSSKQMVDVAYKLAEGINDRNGAIDVLKEAEMGAIHSDDFQKVSEAVLALSDSDEWRKAIADQKERRSLHPALYKEFAVREAELKTSGALILLAGDVLSGTGDAHYAERLLKKAEKLCRNRIQIMDLADAIYRLLKDETWIRRLYQYCLENTSEESGVHAVVDAILVHLDDLEWVKKIYRGMEQGVADAGRFIRLGRVVWEKLGDNLWAGALFDAALDKCRSVASCGIGGFTVESCLHDEERAIAFFSKGIAFSRSVSDYDQLLQILSRMRGYKEEIRKVIKSGERRFSGAMELVFIAERAADSLNDLPLSRSIYEKALLAADGKRRLSDIILSIRTCLKDEKWASRLCRRSV